MRKQAWKADFFFASHRRVPEPQAIQLRLTLQHDPERKVIAELTKREASLLRDTLANMLENWDE